MLRIAILLAVLIAAIPLAAAPRRYGVEDDISVRELRDSLDNLKHEVENHDTEIRMFDERVNNQESAISAMREQLSDAAQANRDLLKGNAANWEERITKVEAANKTVIEDMKKLKTHANETAEALSQYKTRITEIEKLIHAQSQSIDNLQSAMKSLMDALQFKETQTLDSAKGYRVKRGDSLEKIARAHNTTVKAIKDLNNLTDDKIVVGQVIQIP